VTLPETSGNACSIRARPDMEDLAEHDPIRARVLAELEQAKKDSSYPLAKTRFTDPYCSAVCPDAVAIQSH
jgi:hypothetical protein